jgi:hypothetical protein
MNKYTMRLLPRTGVRGAARLRMTFIVAGLETTGSARNWEFRATAL